MKKIFITFLFCSFALFSFSQEATSGIYSGGMLFFQPGYTITNNKHQKIEDISFGIGGILRFYFCDYLTAGIYGGSQKTNYKSSGSSNSYINFGYGGTFLGISRKAEKFRFTISVFAGMGLIRNLHIEKQINDTLSNAFLYTNSTWVISPLVSIDYSITQKLSFTLQTLCLISRYDADRRMLNPAIQIGILFNR
ncbi:MAG: hypothetical protein A2275_12355 [Bacteroidetes bacterium RIFOXYA12_FULL_35_11]|nr:MAG: hypothetical protein A2X01_02410 [Bacteroidetes bacterium GWF2_35_48]OFY77873.1 MAG: hypothetical protein A2275_12355 [Bacteroidetes bacterium RIFOXYA12_FULL_35_11]OFY96019.1 MAG: hypothetical protein A2491_05955 [Bacteroidetes bacterium RIFOXYC12_FULL_35_7]HBX50343.1 hypothetical protein [Bacteroidales bacterium]